MQRNAGRASVVLIATAALALSGCATAAPEVDDGRITVVAVTDTYGSIAESLGGDLVEVTSIITGVAQDPHEYEATARDQLAVQRADLVIVNGGGYDDFMTKLLDSSDAVVIDASDASGLLPSGPEAPADAHARDAADDHDDHAHALGANEHVWYSIDGVERIAAAITAGLLELAPDSAPELTRLGDAYRASLEALHAELHAVAVELGGGDVLSTEFVAAYLLEDLGLHDITPAGFAAAIEDGTGVSARALAEVLDRLAAGELRLVAVSPQSSGPEAERVREAAIEAGVPVIEFAETLPDGLDYLAWMAEHLEMIRAALR